MLADAPTDTSTVAWIILYYSSVSVDLRHLIKIAGDPRNGQENSDLDLHEIEMLIVFTTFCCGTIFTLFPRANSNARPFDNKHNSALLKSYS